MAVHNYLEGVVALAQGGRGESWAEITTRAEEAGGRALECALCARRAHSLERPAATPFEGEISGRWARVRLVRWFRAQLEARA
eukprot:12797372-Alexandrium_andersonii.AAC.1